MRQLPFLLLCLLWSYSTSQACLNVYYSVDHHGHLHEVEDLERPFNTNFNLSLIDKKLQQLEPQLQETKDYKLLSNYAVLLLKAGKTQEALVILEKLALQYPEEYQIAANLGTAYELNGQVEKALFYIQKGMTLNPEAHGGSEWVHLRVLETKLLLQNNPTYLEGHTVLNLTAEEKNDPAIRQQLHVQVRERFPFSPPFDPIMASLLIDLGDCYAQTASIDYARALYAMAKLYHGSKDKTINEKLKDMKALDQKYAQVHPKQTGADVTHVRIERMDYKKLLDDNNTQHYAINWNTTSANSQELISYIAWEPLPVLEEPALPSLGEKCGTQQVEKERQFYTYYLILSSFAVFVCFVTWLKSKR